MTSREFAELIGEDKIAQIVALSENVKTLTTMVEMDYSMNPTLNNGDKMLVSNVFYKPKAGDIVVFKKDSYDPNKALVKRVIATEGQWVEVDYEEGVVRVGDTKDTMVALEENYIAEPATTRYYTDTNDYPIQVPANCVFAMGDNRNNSTDSRSSMVGFVDENYVLGKAVFRIVPFGNFNIYG